MSTFRLAELVGGLSLAADYANGYPPEKCLRSAVLAVAIGQRAGLSEDALRDGYWVTVLRFLGCTAFAHEEAHDYGAGDDLRVRNTMGMADATNPLGTLRSIASNVAKDAPLLARGRAVARLLSEREAVVKHARAQCDQSIHLAEIVDVSADVRGALAQACERFDGKGAPNAIEGEALAASTRLLHIADILEICLHRSGLEYARSELERRSGKHLDPVLVRAALSDLAELARIVSGTSVWEAFLEAEPGRHAERTDATRVATAFAHFADVKSVYTLGHSTRVADIAARAGAAIGLGVEALEDLRAAALLHDVGRVSVPNGIWDKPGPLGSAEWERVRLHAYYTERIALRAPAWARAAKIAAGAHEKPNASGYHRGLPLAVLTNKTEINAIKIVHGRFGERRFPTIVGSVPGRANKPDPEGARLVAERLGVPVEKCWLIGDSELDILTARASGMLGAGLLNNGIVGACDGIELNAGAAQLARSRLRKVWNGSIESLADEIPWQQYDLVILADVLEHLVDPWAALRLLRERTVSGCRLMLSVPNVRHYKVSLPLLFRGEFRYADEGIMDRTHLHFFTRGSLEETVRECGWILRARDSHMKGRYRRWYMPTRLLEPFVAVQTMLICDKR